VLYKVTVRRLALVFVLAFLTCDLSGLGSFLLTERCTSVNDTLPDNACPPTCVRCVCCAQPIVSSAAILVVDLAEPQFISQPSALAVIAAPPHDILHVPKSLSLIA